MSSHADILVCGITGFIGSAVARRLISTGYRVTGLCRKTSQDRSRLDELSGCDLLEYDDEDDTSLQRALQHRPFQAAFNLAAYGVLGTQQDADRMRRTNELLGSQLVKALPTSCLYVHAGSVFEYGTAKSGRLIVETDETTPFSLYGKTKLQGTLNVLQAARQQGSVAVVLRLFHIYGPGEAESRLTPYLITKLLNHDPADLTSGQQIRDFLYVDDAVDAFLHSLTFRSHPPVERIFNVCSSQPVTIRRVGEMLAEILDRPQELLRWGVRPQRTEEPAWLVGSVDRFQQATDWKSTISLNEGLRRFVRDRESAATSIPAPHHHAGVRSVSHFQTGNSQHV